MEQHLHYDSDKASFCSLEANWWLFGLRGIVSIFFGGLMIFEPGPTILATTTFFGAFNSRLANTKLINLRFYCNSHNL